MLSKDIVQTFFGEVGSFPGFGRVTVNVLSISVGKFIDEVAEL